SWYNDKPGNRFLAMSVGDYDVPSRQEDQDYWVVALFAPDAPEIKGLKENAVRVLIPEQMSDDLLKEKLITGAVLTYKPAMGKEQTRQITPEEFGKVIDWEIQGVGKEGNNFALSVHWYYQLDKVTTYVSPESEKAVRGEMPAEEEFIPSSEMPGETEGPAYDGPEKRPELTVTEAGIGINPFSMWNGTPKGESVPSGAGAWGVSAWFDASKGEIAVSYLGDGRWDVRCHTSGGNYAEGVDDSSSTTASLQFIYEMNKGRSINQQGGIKEHIDGSYSLSRKAFIQVGREWFDYQKNKWDHLSGTDVVNTSGSFKGYTGWLPYGREMYEFTGDPETFTFTNNYNRPGDKVLIPGSITIDMSDYQAWQAHIKEQEQKGVIIATDHLLVIYLKYELEKNGYTGE
ncbi:MAG: hypothetical protein LIQ26_04840, partial [Bacteroidota bacterium]|nr:hypothetical protein [Bacteroidota bacterium]